jgi:formylglycine-generating enzyme required for sulfatase activity
MVLVEGGTTTLGWHPEIDADRTGGSKNSANGTSNNIKDAYTATIANFKIGKYEVTQEQWRAVMAGTKFENYFYFGGSGGNVNGTLNSAKCGNVPCDDQRPVEGITWYLAVAFCNELSKQTGLTETYAIGNDKYLIDNIDDKGNCSGCNVVLVSDATGYRLPTTNEWEYAARGCKAGNCESFKYSGSNNIVEVGWCKSFSNGATHPVGQLKPNRLGIYDMSGNVWEWCWDIVTGINRVARGSQFNDDVAVGWHRVAAFYNTPPDLLNNFMGFRVALPAQ